MSSTVPLTRKTHTTEKTPNVYSRFNWSLWAGLLITGFIVFLALYGPALAPSDPLKENFIVVFSEGGFIKPPFAPFLVPGFWLGADEFGRDILSRLLWAVRPTLTLVLVVATMRLIIGLLVGMLAGWVTGRVARWLQRLMAAAVTAPVLFVALAVIALMGQSWGVWAFIVGLSLTGWAEVAQVVREQTRLVKQQSYVESARALGASEAQILTRHVVPQILPLLWVLLALEASSALLTTASLGFLGYFINAIWIPLGDFTGIRATGKPELGQMLNYSLTQPWSSLMAGTLVIVMLLGFNLLGAGLRWHFSPERRERGNWLSRRINAFANSLGDRVFLSLAEWQRTVSSGLAAALLVGVLVGGGWWLWAQTAQAATSDTALVVPGGHLWASAQHDFGATLYTPAHGPATGEIAWSLTEEAGLSGPVVAQDGMIYIASGKNGGTLLALNPAGEILWEATAPTSLIVPRTNDPFLDGDNFVLLGTPALTEAGEILVADGTGSLHAFSPAGTLRWTFINPQPENLLLNPIVGPEGHIYYGTLNYIFSLNAEGNLRWRAPLPTYSYMQPILRLSADGRYLAFQEALLDTTTAKIAFTANTSIEMYVMGADGKTYLRKQSVMEEWQITDTGASIVPSVKLDERALNINFRIPFNGGVTPQGRAWFLYSTGFDSPRIIWQAVNSESPELIDISTASSNVLAVDGQEVSYTCNSRPVAQTLCEAYRRNGQRIWAQNFGQEFSVDFIFGAALAPNRLYLTRTDGTLFAIGKLEQ